MFSSPSQQPGQHRAAQVPHTGEGGAQVNVVGEHHIGGNLLKKVQSVAA